VFINTKANKQWFTASKPPAPAFVLLHQDLEASKVEQQSERSLTNTRTTYANLQKIAAPTTTTLHYQRNLQISTARKTHPPASLTNTRTTYANLLVRRNVATLRSKLHATLSSGTCMGDGFHITAE
jgi:hypothetical protein